MRILIVSFAFPPYNAIGAVRVGKMAKYLRQHGHDVRVLTSRDQPWHPDLPLEIPADEVVSTRWFNVNYLPEMVAGGRERVAAEGLGSATARPGLLARLGRAYQVLLNYPDGQIGWLWPAVRAGDRLVREWRPDVIVASSPPPTGLLVASRLAARSGVPWVADLRDLWTTAPYYAQPGWRRGLESRRERRVLGGAAGLVTVSEPLRRSLARDYPVPTAVVLNGFDAGDYPDAPPPAPDGVVRIVYTGILYGRKRDPAPLFEAMRRMRNAGGVRVSFYGRGVGIAADVAREHGVQDLVQAHPPVPYRESLRLQRSADALLLLPGNEPAAGGAYGGKFFEYLGARRPMVVLADAQNVAAAVVLERSLGIVETDPAALAERLDAWVDAKRRGELLPDLAAGQVEEFTREGQARRLAAFLEQVAHATPARAPEAA